MSDQPRPTPRTDANYVWSPEGDIVDADFARELERESDARAEEIKELREIIGRDQLGKACIYWMDRYHKLAQSDDNPDNRQTISVPKSLIPNGGKLGECYETEREFVICGEVDSDDESHNCDAMGCGSFSHVIARIPKVDLEQGWPIERAENAKLREALARSPMTADGVPIFLGDTVYVENPDSSYFGNEEVLTIQVHYMSADIGFVEYKYPRKTWKRPSPTLARNSAR